MGNCIVCKEPILDTDKMMTRFKDIINPRTGEAVHTVEGRLHKRCSGKGMDNS